jgi:hypothetical protein
MKEPLSKLIPNIKEVQLGEWVHLLAEGAGVGNELQALASLTRDQIQLFLIVGTERPGYQITYQGPESTRENYKKL